MLLEFLLSRRSLLLVVLLLAASVIPTFAASALDLQVYPPVAYLSVKPGAGINHLVKLRNSGLYTLEITPALVNFHGDQQTGQVVLEQKSDLAYLNLDGDHGKWGKSFILKPGEEQSLNFVVAPPIDSQSGEHHLSILFQAKQLAYTSALAKETLISAMVASNVVLFVGGDEQNRGELTIEQFFLPKLVDSFVGFSFSALVKNIGINATPIEGYVKVSHWPDQSTEIYKLYPDMVLAGSKRLVRMMAEADLQELEKMENNKNIQIAAGNDYQAIKEKFINNKLRSKTAYKKSFLLGAYDLELKVGDDILQKRVIALPFSVLAIALVLPFLYWLYALLSKLLRKHPVDFDK